MALRRHPRCHLGRLEQRTKVRVPKHEICGNDCSVSRVARGSRRVLQARDGLLQRALDPVRSDDKVRMKYLARRERDARPARCGSVRLDTTDGSTETDVGVGSGLRKAEEHGVVVRTM